MPKKYGERTNQQQRLVFSTFLLPQVGIELLQKYFPTNLVWPQILAEAEKANLHSGPVHGDFHPGNIFLNHSNRPTLIDWDSFDLNGCWDWEWVHYLVEERAMAKKVNWYDAWRELRQTAAFPGATWSGYYLHRIGNEAKYYKYPEYFLSGIARSLADLEKE